MNLNTDTGMQRNIRLQFIGVLSGLCLLMILLYSLVVNNESAPVLTRYGESGLIQKLGYTLFTKFVLPFELSSVLFLSAMIGAVILGKKD